MVYSLFDNSIAGASDPLSTINPDDIESFTILKDAAATAIYGNRGSGGVIMITTKQGKGGGKIEDKFKLDNFCVPGNKIYRSA